MQILIISTFSLMAVLVLSACGGSDAESLAEQSQPDEIVAAPTIKIGEPLPGLPGYAITRGGGKLSGGGFVMRTTIGEKIPGQFLKKKTDEKVRVQLGLLTITE